MQDEENPFVDSLLRPCAVGEGEVLLGAYLNYLATTSERTPILTYAGAAAGHVEYSVDVHYEAEVRVADRCTASLRAGTDAHTRCAARRSKTRVPTSPRTRSWNR